MLPEAQHWGLIKSKLRPSPAEGMGSTGQVLCAGESWRRERGGNRGAGLEKKVWAGTAIRACRLSHVSGDQRVCVCVFACVNGLVSTIWSFLVMRKHTARNERLPSTSSISGRRPFSPCLVGVEQEVVGDLGVCVCVRLQEWTAKLNTNRFKLQKVWIFFLNLEIIWGERRPLSLSLCPFPALPQKSPEKSAVQSC